MTNLIFKENLNVTSDSNVILIDKQIPNYQIFFDSSNSLTFPIIYSSNSSKKDLLDLLNSKFKIIKRLCFVFSLNFILNYKYIFLDNKFLFDDYEEFSENVLFLIDLIKEFKISNIDFLACNTLNHINWKKYYEILSTNTDVIIGASNDKTGNLKYGGNWILENTGKDIEFIYFTDKISQYQYLLDSVQPEEFSLILLNDNTIYSVGQNTYGELGLGNNIDRNSYEKVTIPDFKIPVAISAQFFSTLVLMNDGRVYATGYNYDGQLGLNDNVNRNSLTLITSLPPITSQKKPISISTAGMSSTILMNDGSVYVCGNNDNGILGLNNTINYNSFTPVTTLPQITDNKMPISISSSIGNIYVLMKDGTVYGCGMNICGQLGLGTGGFNLSRESLAYDYHKSFTLLNTLTKQAIGIYSGLYILFVLMNDNTVYVAGNNSKGQLGIGSNDDYSTIFKLVDTLPSVSTNKSPIDISATNYHSVILMNDKTVYVAGSNEFGQLGIDIDDININTFRQVTTLPLNKTPVSIATGLKFTLILMSDSSVYAAGDNSKGQLGLGYADNNKIKKFTLVTSLIGKNVKSLMNSSLFQNPIPNSNICFIKGTPITTDQELINIDEIDVNYHTIYNKKIKLITRTVSVDKYLVLFKKNSLEENIPLQDTVMSLNHLIFYKNQMIKAKNFVNNFKNVLLLEYNGEYLYNILMEEHLVISVNNLLVETLDPNNKTAKLLELLEEMNINDKNYYTQIINKMWLKESN